MGRELCTRGRMGRVEFLLVAAVLLTAPCVFGGELDDIDKVVDAVGRVGEDPLNPLGSLGEDDEYTPQNSKNYNAAAHPKKKKKAAKPAPKKVKKADPCSSWKGEADAENVGQDCFVSKQMAKIDHDSHGEYVAAQSTKKRVKHAKKHGHKQNKQVEEAWDKYELGGKGPAKKAKKKAKAAVKKVKAQAKKKVRAAKKAAKKKVEGKKKAAKKAKKQAHKKAVKKKNKAKNKLSKAKKTAKKLVKKAKKKVKKAKLKVKKVASKSKMSHLRNKKLNQKIKNMSAKAKSKCNGPIDKKVRSLESALRTCRADIRRVSEKALEANRKLVSTAKAQGVEFKTEEKKKLSKEGKLLASKE